jgi:hypothetical protein
MPTRQKQQARRNSGLDGLETRSDSVSAQAQGKVFQLLDAALLGPGDPILQILQQLLAGGGGAGPQGRQFLRMVTTVCRRELDCSRKARRDFSSGASSLSSAPASDAVPSH